MFKILVVEDNANVRRLMQVVLKQYSFEPILAENAMKALSILDEEYVDLIILDIMMPGMDGFELTREIRESKMNMPILMVSAKGEAADKRKGFIAGTDDYMVKPVDEVEMILRIKALLRRAEITNKREINLKSTKLVYDSFSVIYKGKETVLPKKEFLILFKLLSYPDITFTREKIMDELWGYASESEARTIDVHINRLRDKFKDNEDFKIVTVRGLGYKAVRTDE